MLLFSSGLFGYTDSLFKAVEATYRAGLPNFYKKIHSNQSVKIAYLGGSITRADNGWREQTNSMLQKQFPGTKFEQIMAAIGGTGSDFGAYRLQNHVLDYNPDLVFVEFAVNDNAKTFLYVIESMEGIVRQIWKSNPKVDICFVYTFQKVQLAFYQQNSFPVSVSAMEKVANYYKIPSICMALPVINLINQGNIILQGKNKDYQGKMVFSEDGVHPYTETGHKIYAETVIQHLKGLESIKKTFNHVLYKPLSKNSFDSIKMINVNKIQKSKGWHIVDSVVLGKSFASLLPMVYASTDTSEYVKISFTGDRFGWVDILGPSSGEIVVWVDDNPPKYIKRFDDYCTYYRMSYHFLSGFSEGKHKAIIKISPNKLDKATILAKRNNAVNNYEAFKKQAFYVGAFLINK
jgi:lysophospholipase L1-like esterase